MIETCMICNQPEKNYTPAEEIEFACGGCVQKLLSMDLEEKQRVYNLAVEKNDHRKAKWFRKYLKHAPETS